MKGSVKINIGGLDFHFKGDDEQQVKEAAEEVNLQISSIKNKHKQELPQSTLTLLAAMNTAESNIKLKRQIDNDQKLMLSEMKKMITVLEKALES